jgi:hypothetical protein
MVVSYGGFEVANFTFIACIIMPHSHTCKRGITCVQHQLMHDVNTLFLIH